MLGAIQKKIFVWRTGLWGKSGTNGWSYDTMLVVMNLVIHHHRRWKPLSVEMIYSPRGAYKAAKKFKEMNVKCRRDPTSFPVVVIVPAPGMANRKDSTDRTSHLVHVHNVRRHRR